jgi:hypothetical protein
MLFSGKLSMNIERKMDFIVENLAALTGSQQTTDAMLSALAVRQEKTDRQIRGLQKLVKAGMQMVVKLHKAQTRTDQRMAELAEAQRELAQSQKRTDERFERWLDSINKRSNGHKRKPN